MDLHELDIKQASILLAKKEISSRELTLAMLDRIEKHDSAIGAFITIDRKQALKQADLADKAISEGRASQFTGIPISLKDLLCTIGMPTTCGSRILQNFMPGYDATAVSKLRDQLAVIIGKTNMDEFAMGSSNENSAYQITRNPWNLDHVPGGSSGGAAAAVAAQFCCAALGSDTGGSIRQPASYCGVVGLKPTYGRVSRFGLVSYASSLDQIGPVTRNVEDAALIMNLISGNDPKDSTSSQQQVPDFTINLNKTTKSPPLSSMTAGIPKEYLEMKGIDPDVRAVFDKTIKLLEELGMNITEISLPHAQYVVAAYYIIAPCEASSNLARFDGVKYGYRAADESDLLDMYKKTRSDGFGLEVKRRIIIGTYALSAGYYDAYYGRASQVRTLIMDDFSKAFENCDLILSPVAPTPAFKIGEKIDDPLTMYLTDIFTLSANLAGIPGISIPAGISSNGLPIGFQIMSRWFDEASLLKTGYQLEQNLDINQKFPKI